MERTGEKREQGEELKHGTDRKRVKNREKRDRGGEAREMETGDRKTGETGREGRVTRAANIF